MSALPLMILTWLAADPAPPVVGRPEDFSGVSGGPFVVSLSAEPKQIAPEQPIIVTLRITGQGSLADMPVPNLASLAPYRQFAIEPIDDRAGIGPPAWREFRFRARPRSAEVRELPAYKFVYFNPRLPANRAFQTTYSEAVPLSVEEKKPMPLGPCDAPLWMLQRPSAESSSDPSVLRFWLLFFLPPLAGLAWYFSWRRMFPDEARRFRLDRNRAAAEARNALREPDPPFIIILNRYLAARHGIQGQLPESLDSAPFSEEVKQRTREFLLRHDTSRFAPQPQEPLRAEEAEELLMLWEAST